MYKLKDYLSNGLALVNNTLRPRHKHITNLMLYTTSRCQSRCRHCHIWEKPRQDLSLSDIRRIMSAKCVRPSTTVGLEGGEFVLHPQADEILGWFRQHHPNYTLLSNCLAPERVIAAVRQHRPLHLYVSLDGDRETYLAMRGVDGHDRVIRVIEELKGELPISIMFCLTPWNDLSDMDYCIGVARRYGIDIRIGIYGTMSFFDTSAEMLDSDSDFLSRIPRSIHDTSENFDFVALYEYWRRGELRLPCRSIFSELVVHPDGTVPICQNLGTSLGNIHDRSLDDIFNSEESLAMQRRHCRSCNGCWINFHRKYDIILLRSLERMMPKRFVQRLAGKYQWNADANRTYSSVIKEIRDNEKAY